MWVEKVFTRKVLAKLIKIVNNFNEQYQKYPPAKLEFRFGHDGKKILFCTSCAELSDAVNCFTKQYIDWEKTTKCYAILGFGPQGLVIKYVQKCLYSYDISSEEVDTFKSIMDKNSSAFSISK